MFSIVDNQENPEAGQGARMTAMILGSSDAKFCTVPTLDAVREKHLE